MPVLIETTPSSNASPVREAIGLKDASGNPTVEAQLLQEFAAQLDYTSLFEDSALRAFVTEKKGFAKEANGALVACQPTDEGAVAVIIETLAGRAAAASIDEDDSRSMFGYYVVQCLPEDTLTNRTVKEIGASMLESTDLQPLDEGTKTAFNRLRRGGSAGKGKVNEMLTAVIAESVIARAKPTTGVPALSKGGKASWKPFRAGNTAVNERIESRWHGKAPASRNIKAALKASPLKESALKDVKASLRKSPALVSNRSIYESASPLAMTAAIVQEMKREGR